MKKQHTSHHFEALLSHLVSEFTSSSDPQVWWTEENKFPQNTKKTNKYVLEKNKCILETD